MANKAASRTAALARSFIIPAFLLYSGETRSTKTSSAVFNSSATRTNAMAAIIHNHSDKSSLQ